MLTRAPSTLVLANSGDGSISINEFFLWSLGNAADKFGTSALVAAFQKYDEDNTGHLDLLEFEKCVASMGYGTVAHVIFQSLDEDGSGTISYNEILESLKKASNRACHLDRESKDMLTNIMWSEKQSCSSIDTTGWVLRGQDAQSIRKELQGRLGHSARVVDLVKVRPVMRAYYSSPS